MWVCHMEVNTSLLLVLAISGVDSQNKGQQPYLAYKLIKLAQSQQVMALAICVSKREKFNHRFNRTMCTADSQVGWIHDKILW